MKTMRYNKFEIAKILINCNSDDEVEQTVDITFSLADTVEEIFELCKIYRRFETVGPQFLAVGCCRELAHLRIKELATEGGFK